MYMLIHFQKYVSTATQKRMIHMKEKAINSMHMYVCRNGEKSSNSA